MRSAIAAALTVGLLVVGLPGGAWAGTAEDPELTDPCGPAEEVGSDLLPEAAAPWVDVCGAWFTTLTGASGPPALQVSVAFAGDITSRPAPAGYYLSWRVGDCQYMVERDDPGTSTGEVSELRYRCGPAYDVVDCDPPNPLLTCSDARPFDTVPLPDDVFTEDGNVLRATLVFAEGLGHYAADFAAGATLGRLYASAHTMVSGGQVCSGPDCTTTLGDTASGGRDYVVEPGSGPDAPGPLVPSVQQCVAGSIDTASADRPHVVDPADDHTATAATNPDAQEPGYDVRALWLTRAAQGVDLHLLPAGPGDPATTAYYMWLAGRTVYVEGQPDGSWSGRISQGDMSAQDSSAVDIDVTGDPSTGEIVVAIPAEQLAGVTAITIEGFYSHYLIGGQAPRPFPGLNASHGVDDDRNARTCEAHLA